MFRNPKTWLVVALVVLVLGMSLGSARAADPEELVGRWNYSLDEHFYARLNADGTFKLVAGTRTLEGQYRVLDGGDIEFDSPGLIYGRNKEEIKYRLSMDTLEFKVKDIGGKDVWIKYQRAK